MQIADVERLKLKAKFFRGFADPTRLAILELLRDGEVQATDIAARLNQSPSNISNHLSCLMDCGLVQSRREGRTIHYSIRLDKVREILEDADEALKQVYDEISACVKYNE
ncbi:MAG: metalloregulator ArsR/SmtB family transcription factor [Thaumarchaeota archaeon]|nr:metalloregulator ArsR/SmtB family transcription factor [Nitrososphaerota archaeon]MCL5317121.1 metalloregulator ArsR/SmtB family transcription factor [Nitrososphaerota archaeon]